MPLRASDIVPISEVRARLTELAEDEVGSGVEKVLTSERANSVLVQDAIAGLQQALAGQFVPEGELAEALSAVL